MTAGSAASVDRDRGAADLSRRLRSAGLFAFVFVGAILLGPWTFVVLVAAIGLIGAFELRGVLQKLGWGRGSFWLFLAPALTPAILFRLPPEALAPGTALVLVAAVGWLIRPVAPTQRVEAGRPSAAARLAAFAPLAGFLGALYLSLLPSFLVRLHAGPWNGASGLPAGALPVLYPVLLVWAADSGAYAVGLLIGRHRLWPAVSPKKTWEGGIGGILAAVIAAVALASPLRVELGLGEAVGAGILVGVFASLGDLFESRLKRVAGIKDSGRLLPGHGGVLDRFDSLFFVAPVFYYYLLAIVGRV